MKRIDNESKSSSGCKSRDLRSRGWGALANTAVYGLSIVLLAFCSCGRERSNGLSREDQELTFGKDGITYVDLVDGSGRALIFGKVRIKDNKMIAAHDEPGGVLVVGVEEGLEVEGRHFEYGHILLRNSKGLLVLAPPGTVLTIPEEQSFCGRTYEPGTFVVPSDSKFPPAQF